MERVGAVIRGMERKDTFHRRLAETRALESWPEVVGPLLAGKTRALRIAGERLFVAAHGAALRQELTFHKSTILRKFNESAGMRAAREIVFLESDSNLSSLVEASERAEPAGGLSVADGEIDREPEGDTMPEPEEGVTYPVYEKFDAVAYRRELAEIAEG